MGMASVHVLAHNREKTGKPIYRIGEGKENDKGVKEGLRDSHWVNGVREGKM